MYLANTLIHLCQCRPQCPKFSTSLNSHCCRSLLSTECIACWGHIVHVWLIHFCTHLYLLSAISLTCMTYIIMTCDSDTLRVWLTMIAWRLSWCWWSCESLLLWYVTRSVQCAWRDMVCAVSVDSSSSINYQCWLTASSLTARYCVIHSD